MKRVTDGAISKWKVSGAMLQANQKGHGRCYKQMEGSATSKMKRVMGGAIGTWKASCAVLQASGKDYGWCYKQMEGVLGDATRK